MRLKWITAYFLCHGHWTVIPHQLDENFADMADCGFNAVAISFSESEEQYSRRAFEIQVNLAHKRGLKVFAIPSRIGNRFAGAPWCASYWLAMHPQCALPNRPTWPLACIENKEFTDWAARFCGMIVGDYGIDGLIWDEPKCPENISLHPDTLARYGATPTPEQMMGGFLEFMENLNRHCRAIRPGLVISSFACLQQPEFFTSRIPSLPGIDYFGYDGNLARQSRFHEEPRWDKYRIESVWDRTVKECGAHGKGTFALIENMLMPREAIPEYEENLDRYLQTYRPDHLALYYYAHNNEDPEAVHAITRRLMKRHLGSR